MFWCECAWCTAKPHDNTKRRTVQCNPTQVVKGPTSVCMFHLVRMHCIHRCIMTMEWKMENDDRGAPSITSPESEGLLLQGKHTHCSARQHSTCVRGYLRRLRKTTSPGGKQFIIASMMLQNYFFVERRDETRRDDMRRYA